MIDVMKRARNLLLAYQNMGDFRIANDCLSTVHALTKAIEQAEKQEPVAWMMPEYGDVLSASVVDGTGIYSIPLYTAPQKYCPSENNAAYEKGFVEGMAKQMHSSVDRAVNAMTKPWVGLTDEEFADLWSWSMTYEAERFAPTQKHAFARAIEQRLKEKNI